LWAVILPVLEFLIADVDGWLELKISKLSQRCK
jgi:hypothetical protein